MGTGFNFFWPEYAGQSQRNPSKDYYLEGRENLHPDSTWGSGNQQELKQILPTYHGVAA